MHKIILKQSVILFYSSIFVACAGTSEPSGGGSYADEPAGSDCISQSSVRDYKVLDDANLIITAGAGRKYHVLLSRRAMNLRSSRAIAFDSNTGRICSKFSDLIVDSSFGPDRIRIASVRRLTQFGLHIAVECSRLQSTGRRQFDYHRRGRQKVPCSAEPKGDEFTVEQGHCI